MGRTEVTFHVRPSVPSGPEWTVRIQGLGRTEGTSLVYQFIPLVRCEVKLSVDVCRQYWTSMIARLKELKEMPNNSTWLKDHVSVFSDSQQLGGQNIFITEDENFEESVPPIHPECHQPHFKQTDVIRYLFIFLNV